MASSVVGALRVVLGLDSAEFTSGINRANRATGQFAKQGKTFETATRGMSTALRGLTAALGILSDRKSVVQGQGVSVRVDLGGSRHDKKTQERTPPVYNTHTNR